MGEERARTRGRADVVPPVIELGRAVKACRFYARDDPARKTALDRAYRALVAEVARGGALELERGDDTFRVAGGPERIGGGTIPELTRAWAERGLERVRFETGLEAGLFESFAEALALDGDELAEAGGLAGALGEDVRGLSLGLAAAASAPQPKAAPPPAPDDEDADLPAPKRQTTGVDPLVTLGELLRSPPAEIQDGALRPEAEGDRGAELVGFLRGLDECRDDERYTALVQRVTAEAAGLPAPSDDAYRGILVLAAHSSDSTRSERQRALAEEALFLLATGTRLDDVVRRACAAPPEASVRATQILLQLGAHAVPRLVDALLVEAEAERRGQLGALLVAMGEKATPEVKDSLESENPDRARLAARLAGEMQNPGFVPYLRNVLHEAATPTDLAREVTKALARIGTPSAVQTLAEGLASPRAETASASALCLGATGAARALEPLVGALRRALRDDQIELARESIRALGRLGRPEAMPVLDDILSRRTLLGRKRLRELKLAAATALARLPGEDARACLARHAEARGDAQVRRAAQAALHGRRADS